MCILVHLTDDSRWWRSPEAPAPTRCDRAARRNHNPYAMAASPRSSLQRGWAQVPQNRVLLPQAITRSQAQVVDCEMRVVRHA